jgi:hypothetical protein
MNTEEIRRECSPAFTRQSGSSLSSYFTKPSFHICSTEKMQTRVVAPIGLPIRVHALLRTESKSLTYRKEVPSSQG